MKQRAFAPCVVLLLLALSGCSNSSAGVAPIAAAPAGVPVVAARPVTATSSTVITALNKTEPVAGITVAIWKAELPTCLTCQPKLVKKLASGKTGPKGRVSLSGAWTRDTLACADGSYMKGARRFEATVCRRPFPEAAKLEFQ
jgi:hypothetical protein